MPNVFEHRVTPGAVRLSRRWEAEANRGVPRGGGGTNSGTTGVSTAGRKQIGWSARSRRAMRYEWSALPWHLLGPRPVMVTLTYPREWRRWCGDSRALADQREAFKEAWRRRYGMPFGVWVVEFQPRERRPVEEQKAPHVHMYLGLPACVDHAEYMGYVVRTLKRKRLEREHDKYEARGQIRAPEGEFADWLLTTWHRIVGSGDRNHRYRGADIAAVYFSEKAEREASRVKIADYMWRESGKWGQKTPPDNFGGLAYYGRWGGKGGFVPLEGRRDIDEAVYYKMRRVYRRCVDARQRAVAEARGLPYRRYRGPRGRDGLTLFVPEAVDLAARVEEWATEEVLSRGMALAAATGRED